MRIPLDHRNTVYLVIHSCNIYPLHHLAQKGNVIYCFSKYDYKRKILFMIAFLLLEIYKDIILYLDMHWDFFSILTCL